MDGTELILLDNLPLEFAGFDESLFIRLRDLVLRTGQTFVKDVRSRQWPHKLTVSASAVPGQLRLMIVDGSGEAAVRNVAMITMDPEGQAYVLIDRRIPADLIREILDAEAPQN